MLYDQYKEKRKGFSEKKKESSVYLSLIDAILLGGKAHSVLGYVHFRMYGVVHEKLQIPRCPVDHGRWDKINFISLLRERYA
ncbi:hypothetical protein F2Q68_00041448 [Brassica cretica]|uniref:Uncharacterized protein n=1 Tax=Brassica cretica TaxID=69181 RepID=A0A8S9MMZ4_BRACR|nr:hypothetical protein F2Q68_00041448 [Brassica cretica]